MISHQSIQDWLRRAFAPTQLGIVGLTDQLLGACVGIDITFERIGDRCVGRWTLGGEMEEAELPLLPSAFRPVLARIAVLCNERRPNSATPYGGEGLVAVEGQPSMLMRIAFVNTPERQQLEVKGSTVFAAVEHGESSHANLVEKQIG